MDSRVILQAAGDISGNLAYISYEAKEVWLYYWLRALEVSLCLSTSTALWLLHDWFKVVDNGELVILYNTSVPAGQAEIEVVGA